MRSLVAWWRRSSGRRPGPASENRQLGPEPTPGPELPVLDVAAVPDLAVMGPGLEFTSRGRFRCGAAPEEADVLLVTPSSPGALRELRERLGPRVDVVVVDRRGACGPELVAALLDGGATTVVAGGSSAVLVAHLDALARRRRARARRRSFAHS